MQISAQKISGEDLCTEGLGEGEVQKILIFSSPQIQRENSHSLSPESEKDEVKTSI